MPADTPSTLFSFTTSRQPPGRRARAAAVRAVQDASLQTAPTLFDLFTAEDDSAVERAALEPARLEASPVPLTVAVAPAPPVQAFAAIPAPAPARTAAHLYSVRELIAELRGYVEGAYAASLHVEGEISNLRAAASGHVYFTLKDGDAQLPVVLFRRQAQMLPWKPRDGMAVEVRGRVSLYESRGQLQLTAESVRPRGVGALQAAFEELRERLRREGLFDREKRALPAFPRCIGVVTSPSGAALRDIVQVARRRHARLNLLVYPAVVQGAGCAASVAAGVRWFNRHPDRVDLILVARGGGSYEDLAGFNDEALARAIAASALPVVSAVGHEIDTTIADFVADLRASTPSAAAELITAQQHRIGERVAELERRVSRAGKWHLLHARQRLARLSAAQVLLRVRDAVGRRQQRVDELRFRLQAAAVRPLRPARARLAAVELRLHAADPARRLQLARARLLAAQDRLRRVAARLPAPPRSRLDALAARLERTAARLTLPQRARVERAVWRLEALSPLAVLSRGYAIVYAADGTILRSAAAVQPGSEVQARLGEGSLRARVLSSATASPTDPKDTP